MLHITAFLSGFAASAFRDRIIDAQVKVVITADGCYRGGKLIQLKNIADEASEEAPGIEKVIVVRLLGTTNILFEGTPTYPTPERRWRIVEKYNVTILYTSPTAIRGLMGFGEDWPAKSDLSSLHILGSVGEPINPEEWMWYRRNIGTLTTTDTFPDELPMRA